MMKEVLVLSDASENILLAASQRSACSICGQISIGVQKNPFFP